ncbi:MAG: hypothetical protein ACLP5E_04175 [Streptosporangiaceae bacterium]
MTCVHRARVQRHFAPIQATARTNALAALDSARYFALRDALDELMADQLAARLRAKARRTWKRAPRPRFSHWAR